MIRINKAGTFYIILTLLIGFSAVNTGNNLVYILTSALLSYMLVSGIFGRRNISGVEVEIDPPQEIFAGVDTLLGVRLVNRRKRMPAFLIRVAVDGQEALFPFVAPGNSATHALPVRFERRGPHTFDRVHLSSVFPFNLFTRYRTLHQPTPVIVFPRPQKCRIPYEGDRRVRTRGESLSNAVGDDSDILSIRDYVPGDPTRYISWKSTAKTGRLKTKELSSMELQHVMIDLNRVDAGNLESAVSCATYTILRLIRAKTPVGLVIDGETFRPGTSPGHKLRMLTRLALYGQD